MSRNREQKRVAKDVIWRVMQRIALMGRALALIGENPAKAVRRIKRRGIRDRAHWRRWYKANRKHQRRLAALRRAGANVRNIPHSLSGWMVP